MGYSCKFSIMRSLGYARDDKRGDKEKGIRLDAFLLFPAGALAEDELDLGLLGEDGTLPLASEDLNGDRFLR